MSIFTIILIIGVVVILALVSFAGYMRKMIRSPLHYHDINSDAITVDANVAYDTPNDQLKTMDIYYPKDFDSALKYPIVLLVSGDIYSFMAKGVKNWQIFQDYGKLCASKGFITVVQNRRMSGTFSKLNESYSDIKSVLSCLKKGEKVKGVDLDNISIWSFSGGGIYLGKILKEFPIKKLLSFYSLMDPMQFRKYITKKITNEELKQFSMIEYVKSEKTIPELFIAEAVHDRAMINDSIDDLVKTLGDEGLQYTYVIHEDGKHGFDVMNKNNRTIEIINQAIDFLCE